MIVSVVIAALLKMRGDTNHLFMKIQKDQHYTQLSTFLVWNKKYGLDKSHTTLYNLVDDFDMDDELRRELKQTTVDIEYKELKRIDIEMNTFTVGETIVKSKLFDMRLKRVELQ